MTESLDRNVSIRSLAEKEGSKESVLIFAVERVKRMSQKEFGRSVNPKLDRSKMRKTDRTSTRTNVNSGLTTDNLMTQRGQGGDVKSL